VKLTPATRKRLDSAVNELFAWYAENQRDFIWRRMRIDPYVVMVSEFMLQQTQAGMIDKHLPRFLKLFPNVRKLAAASSSDVLRAWQGLGYNRRALNLHRAAQELAKMKRFPETQQDLMALPGIGRYTSAAILAFAYNKDVPVVDVNIERVLSRIWKKMTTHDAVLPMDEIESLDAAILPSGRSSEWHQALMDHGSSICVKRNPKCIECPALEQCASGKYFIRNPEISRPAKMKSRQRLFHGHPRRIWRGRVLKAIVENGPITAAAIKKQLKLHDEVPLAAILEALVTEGFVQRHRSSYSLR
jgi:A/G-specific adenine glycosylase